MKTDFPSELGKTAAKLLHDRLTEAGILDELYSRIVETMPAVVQEAQVKDSSLLPMFRATASQYAMCFAYARLAFRASTMFTKRPWGEFTDGVLKYASESTGYPPATRAHIVEDINDHQNAVERFCSHYPPEARQVLLNTTQRIDHIVSDVLAGLDTGHRMPILSLLKFIVLLLFGLGATLLIGLAYPVFLFTTLVLGVLGFKMGKSTRVPLNPRDVPFSPMTVLSYREFDRWARENDLRVKDTGFFSRTDVHWTEKISVLFLGSDAAGHCFEPGRSTTKILLADVALGAFIFFPGIRESFEGLSDIGAIFFQFMCGLVLGQLAGRASGNFYRWIRGQM